MKHELIVAGVGPGAAEQMTPAVLEAIRGAACAVAAPRHVPLTEGHPNVLKMGKIPETLDRIADELEQGNVAVMVSGDTGIYSLLPLLRRRFPDTPLRVLPGLSALQCLAAEMGETWADAAILSGHGRSLTAARLLNTVERSRLTVLFCGGECSPAWACRVLAEAVGGLDERAEAVVGERLSCPDQNITQGHPSELAGREFDSLSIMMVRNAAPWVPPFGRPQDEDFERGAHVPMTRAEVRSMILDRLRLTPDAVLWDIGAGTGSVSAAAALACPDGEVHSLECAPDALELLSHNREKFRLHNMTIHAGRALSLVGGLPRPTRVFVGGSGGELPELLAHIASSGCGVRVVVSAVTLNTLVRAAAILSGPDWQGLEAVQATVAVSRPLGSGPERNLLMSANNPVTLLCAWTANEQNKEESR